MSTKELKEIFNQLFVNIYELDCFTSSDLKLYEQISQEMRVRLA